MKKMITKSFQRDTLLSLKKRVGLCCGLFLMLLVSTASFGQGDCLNEEQWPSDPIVVDPTGAPTVSTFYYQGGEYSEVTGIVSGEDYLFDHGASNYVTVRIGAADGPILGQGATPLLVTANSDDNLFPHWNLDENCGIDLVSPFVNSTIQCASCEDGGGNGDEECDNSSIPFAEYGSADVDQNGALVVIATDQYPGGEFSPISNVLTGNVLEFAMDGGAWITVRIGTPDGEVLGSGESPLSVEATSDDDLFVHWNTDADCGTSSDAFLQTTVQCTSCEPVEPDGPTIVDCEQGPVDEPYCYGNNEASEFLYESNDGSPLMISFSLGFLESCCDDISIYAGDTDEAPLMNEGETAGDFAGRSYSTANFGEASSILVVFSSDGSGSCQDGLWGVPQDGASWSVACAEPIVCEEPELSLLPFEFGAQLPIEGCLEEGSDWLIEVAVSGGSGNSAYNILVNGEDIDQQVLADGSTFLGGFVAGDVVDVEVVGADDDMCGAEGSIGVEACPPPAPENDDCANAIPLGCNQSVFGSVVSANASQDGCGFATSGNGVWYSIQVEQNSLIRLRTCNEDTDFDSDLSIYTGACDALECFSYTDGTSIEGESCPDADPPFTFDSFRAGIEFEAEAGVLYTVQLHSYDDSQSGNFRMDVECIPILCEAPELSLAALNADGALVEDCLEPGSEFFVVATLEGGSGNGSYSVSANGGDPAIIDAEGSSEPIGPFLAGTSVDVVVTGNDDGECGAEGSISVEECLPPAPENDNCENAQALVCGESVFGSTASATSSEDGCNPSSFVTSGPGVWYSIQVEQNSIIRLRSCNPDTDFDSDLSVYTGSCDELACFEYTDGTSIDGESCPAADPPFTFSTFRAGLEFEAEAGVLYTVQLHGYGSGDAGNFRLDVECEEILPCENTEYDLLVDGGSFDSEISWNLLLDGEIVANGGAPEVDEVLCLADGCYTLELFDSFGDGWNGNEFSLSLDGEIVAGPFTLEDGEEGIAEFGLGDVVCGEPGCENYEYYLADILEDGTTNIYEIAIDGSDADLSLIATSEIEVHIALNEDNGLLYAVSKADGSYRTLDPETGDFGPVELLDTEVAEIVGAAFNADGKLLISSQSQNAIYSVMLGSNAVSVFDSYSPILGGDIDFGQDGALYLATREGFGTFYQAIPDEIAADILKGDAPQLVTGVADTEAGQLIFSHRDALTLEVRDYDGTVQDPLNLLLDGESFMTFNGDLASGCADNRQELDPCDEGGNCNAVTAAYVQGTTSGGGSIDPARANPANSLGAPEGTDELVFTSLGFGGSLTFEFDGSVPNEDGDDIQVIETTFGNPGCEVYPEYADVSVSVDGEDFYYIGTVCKSDNSVDISDAEIELACVNFVRVANNDGLTTANGDGFDVDGIIAIHNCDDAADEIVSDETAETVSTDGSSNTLRSYPNPTTGPSVAVFTTDITERATLEVYDMNGRLVEGLFSGIAEAGVEYRIDYNGLELPNGVYMYRLTTDSETVVEKFMIAK